MASMDVFNNDAFSMQSMTEAVNKVEFRPSLARSLGVFQNKPIRTTQVGIEDKDGVLSLIKTSERGAPIEEASNVKRKYRYFETARIAKGDTIQASEIQNIRAFGSETELMQVQREVAERLDGDSGIMRDVELTWENQALGALQGLVLDADGSTLYDWYSEWNVTQATEIDFDLDNATPAEGAVRKKCMQVIRQMMTASKGAWTPSTRIMALCGDNFYDDLVTHPEIVKTYLNQQSANSLRNDIGLAYDSFRYGNIEFINYRGTDDGTTVSIGTDKAKFFPVGANGVFQKVISPGESLDYANTLGREVYSLVVRDKDRNFWVRPEVYSYCLFICTRPAMLQRAKRT